MVKNSSLSGVELREAQGARAPLSPPYILPEKKICTGKNKKTQHQ